MISLQGKAALVTGGGTGIGAAIALFIAGLPPHGTTGQVFSLAGRLL